MARRHERRLLQRGSYAEITFFPPKWLERRLSAGLYPDSVPRHWSRLGLPLSAGRGEFTPLELEARHRPPGLRRGLRRATAPTRRPRTRVGTVRDDKPLCSRVSSGWLCSAAATRSLRSTATRGRRLPSLTPAAEPKPACYQVQPFAGQNCRRHRRWLVPSPNGPPSPGGPPSSTSRRHRKAPARARGLPRS